MSGAYGDLVKTIKTIFITEKFNFLGKKLFSGERFRIKGVILHELQDGYLSSKTHVKGELFPLTFALLGGGGVWTPPPPCGFSRIAWKRRRRRVFTYLIPHLFDNFCESFDPGSCKVRSPGQVKWPYLTKTLQSRPSYSVWGKVMQLSEYDKVIGTYKMYILDFWYRWP